MYLKEIVKLMSQNKIHEKYEGIREITGPASNPNYIRWVDGEARKFFKALEDHVGKGKIGRANGKHIVGWAWNLSPQPSAP